MDKQLNEYLKREENNLNFPQNRRLAKLYKWLNVEIPFSALFVFSFFIGPIALVGTIAISAFALYMARILYLERKMGWIITLILFLLIPAVVIKLLGSAIPAVTMFYLPVLIVSFLVYSILLKVSIPAMLDN